MTHQKPSTDRAKKSSARRRLQRVDLPGKPGNDNDGRPRALLPIRWEIRPVIANDRGSIAFLHGDGALGGDIVERARHLTRDLLVYVRDWCREGSNPRFDPFIGFLSQELSYALYSPNHSAHVRGLAAFADNFSESADRGEEAVAALGVRCLAWERLRRRLDLVKPRTLPTPGRVIRGPWRRPAVPLPTRVSWEVPSTKEGK